MRIGDVQDANWCGIRWQERDVVAAQCEPVALDQRRVADTCGASGSRNREDGSSTHDFNGAMPA
jgi:hypothetical protein